MHRSGMRHRICRRHRREKKSSPNSAEQIEKLQDRVTKLESRIALLEKMRVYLAAPQASTAPGLGVHVERLPEGWQKREFNGMPYYLVPLDCKTKSR